MSKDESLIGERIRKVRTLRGHTQTELGKALGLVKQTISTIEKGQRKVTTDELKTISLFLKAPVNVFLEDKWFKDFEENQASKMRNRWKIDVPYIIDDTIDALDEHFEFIVNSEMVKPKAAMKQIENTIKLFQLYLKEFKEENNL